MGDDELTDGNPTSGELRDDILGRIVGARFVEEYARLDAIRRVAVERAAVEPSGAPRTTPAIAARSGGSGNARPEIVATADADEPAQFDAPPAGPARAPAGRARARRGAPAREGRLPLRRDRREEIVEQLRSGPASAQELAELFEISREGVLRWLRMLEADGRIESTAMARTSRNNRWVLAQGAPAEAGASGGADASDETAPSAPGDVLEARSSDE